MLETRGLCAGYNGKTVIRDVDLSFNQGQVTIIAGPNGCGKSTLFKTLTGMLRPSSGTIMVCGSDASGLRPQELARRIAYLPQNRTTPDITALRLVLHGRFPYLSYPRRYSRRDIEIARDALARMGISDAADAPLSALSGGTRQKVYIAMALAQNAPVILLDEPTTFLDVAHQLQMMEHARFLAAQGKTVAMVLHDISMALRYADSLVAMENGRAVIQDSPQRVYESGCLNSILGVHIAKADTPYGPHYYFTAHKEQ